MRSKKKVIHRFHARHARIMLINTQLQLGARPVERKETVSTVSFVPIHCFCHYTLTFEFGCTDLPEPGPAEFELLGQGYGRDTARRENR